MAVIEVTDRGLVLKEVAADTTAADVQAATGAELIIEQEPGSF
jgi:acyl CoA:acetate/3-ketoacid CoA transferase beta subunit